MPRHKRNVNSGTVVRRLGPLVSLCVHQAKGHTKQQTAPVTRWRAMAGQLSPTGCNAMGDHPPEGKLRSSGSVRLFKL
jgi:hypothetical protein